MGAYRETLNGLPATDKKVSETDLISDNGMILLNTIDKLRGLGIDKDIPLPQIVVVGSQSAGKSSVLEAISGISFPVNDGQCTTFASEIRLRRSKEEAIAVNVVSKSAFMENKKPLEIFGSQAGTDTKSLDWSQMPRIIDQATETMSSGQGQKFCEDMLRIEVSGPNQDHLTLIDLPGIFHVLKPGQDPTAPQRVKDTVLQYMREKRSIILAVVSAKDDYSNQEILKTVEAIDPSGIRTMGVITGIDMTPDGSTREQDYVSLARNELVPLALGWHVVRNLSFEDRKSTKPDRDTKELEFFATRKAWQSVPEQDCGAPQLKRKLKQVLLTHIGKELGDVITALEQRIETSEKVIKQLGPGRTTMFEKRGYLTQIGARHQELCRAALNGTYEDPFFETTGQRLRATIVDEYDRLEKAISNGHRWDFWTRQDAVPTPKWLEDIGAAASFGQMMPCHIRLSDYLAKVDTVLKRYRGRELQGTFDPLLIGVLFKDQAFRWRSIAQRSLENMMNFVKSFMERAVMHLMEPRRAQLLLKHRLFPDLHKRRQTIMEKLEELLKPFQNSAPRTHNPLFRQSYDRLEKDLVGRVARDDASGADLKDPEACEELALKMQCYYEIARPTFVDNVINLGVEQCLLDGLADTLSPLSISSMTDQEIDQLASEFPEDTVKRKKISRELETLRSGRDVCREFDQHEPREHFPSSEPVFSTGGTSNATMNASSMAAKPRSRNGAKVALRSRPEPANSSKYLGSEEEL
ncbi:uncharacterized protein HMPREF1541_01279 [Cyphellophora europaea CBS 101466]|uniref:GED domain-containing protein n=1 Tax=Cyphellophora europaea (strain CBS 101466) TaxID=1220924 RepID=W2SGS9_CYPE1|nr:uncharacterized protein HMPREF1541_01279 [Cyphellophora europaea CBS 101466]ETN47089.1 hypothetical protein HMPREF1541_01279 [Cyphellophora europaea CBS 101466]